MKRYVLDCELLRGRRQRSGPIGRAGRRDSGRFVVDNTTLHAGKIHDWSNQHEWIDNSAPVRRRRLYIRRKRETACLGSECRAA